VTSEWPGCYDELALAAAMPVHAQADPGRAWIVVNVTSRSNHRQATATMDAARALISEANAAAQRMPAATKAEASIRDWWASMLGKLAMTVQAVASLMTLGLVIARAVNIFK
jgi:hypothetical protein